MENKVKFVKKNIVCLRMENIYSFLSCTKSSWLRRISSSESNLRDIVLNFFPDMQMYSCKNSESFLEG